MKRSLLITTASLLTIVRELTIGHAQELDLAGMIQPVPMTAKFSDPDLWESADGANWKLAQHPLVATPEVTWANGQRQKLKALERPQVLLDSGKPIALFCAAAEDSGRDGSFNIQIPLSGHDKSTSLEIPDTDQEPRRPDAGWCGESAIQMALSYYGAYASQKAINRAGKPEHPDLYSNNIPVAMNSLGLEFKAWRGKGLPAFLKWIQAELAVNHPVLLGVKIYPTAHPEWYLDHFVLGVGCTQETITLNTTWGRQETRTLALLSSEQKGLSFANPFNAYYGYTIAGLKTTADQANLKPTRIKLRREADGHVELRVTMENLERGNRYRLVKFADLSQAQRNARGELVRSFVAEGPKAEFVEKVEMDEARVFRCISDSLRPIVIRSENILKQERKTP